MSHVPPSPPSGEEPDGSASGSAASKGAAAEPSAHRGLAAIRRTDEFVDAFAAGRRARAAADAAELRMLARAGELVEAVAWTGKRAQQEMARRSMIAELACAARISEWTIARVLADAADLCTRFAAGVDALEAGEISRQHLSVIHDAGQLIRDDADRAAYLDAALGRARETTPGRLAPVVKALAERYLARSLQERHDDAATRRDVSVTDMADGMSCLTAILPAVLAHGIDDRLTQQARAVLGDTDAAQGGEGGEGGETGDGGLLDGEVADDRTLAQVRADVFTDLLLTGTPDRAVAGDGVAAIRATVQITVPVLTMTGASAQPILLAGYGPIDTATASTLAGAAPLWARVLTDPHSGAVLATDRYVPDKRLRRHLRARDERCRFPGCRRPVWRCDTDHTVDWARGGTTSPENLAHLCRRHHTLKHNSAWTVAQVAAGVLVWTSPSGRRHTDHPEPMVRFEPEPDLSAYSPSNAPPFDPDLPF